MLVLNLPFKALMFLTLMRPSLVLFLVLWLKLVKDFLKVRCRLALLPLLISCLIWLDLVASLPLIKERILVIILLLHFQSLMLGSVLVLMLPRSEERFSRNAETELVCRLLLEKKNGEIIARVGPGTCGNPQFSSIDPALKRPYMDEIALGFESRPRPSTVLRLAALARRAPQLS